MEKRSRLSLFRLAAGLTGSQVAQLLRDRFRLVDKTVISKAEHPELYGVELSKEAWAALEAAHPRAAQKAKNKAQGRKADRHKKTRRVTVRVAEGEFSMLQQRLEAEGLTVQGILSDALAEYVGARGWIAPARGTPHLYRSFVADSCAATAPFGEPRNDGGSDGDASVIGSADSNPPSSPLQRGEVLIGGADGFGTGNPSPTEWNEGEVGRSYEDRNT